MGLLKISISMEKEQKIEEMNRQADERSFYGRLRQHYDAFAIFWISLLRLFAFFAMGIQTDASGFIFPTQSLNVVNLPITVIVTFVAQTAVGCLIYGQSYQTVDTGMFNVFFCAMLGAI